MFSGLFESPEKKKLSSFVKKFNEAVKSKNKNDKDNYAKQILFYLQTEEDYIKYTKKLNKLDKKEFAETVCFLTFEDVKAKTTVLNNPYLINLLTSNNWDIDAIFDIKYFDQKKLFKIIELDKDDFFINKYFRYLCKDPNLLGILEKNLIHLSPYNLVDMANMKNELAAHIIYDRKLMEKLRQDDTAKILCIYVLSNKGFLPDNFFSDKIYEKLDRKSLYGLLAKTKSIECCSAVMQSSNLINYFSPSDFAFVIAVIDNKELSNFFCKYLLDNLQRLTREELKDIFLTAPVSGKKYDNFEIIAKFLLDNSKLLTALNGKDVESMFILRPCLRSVIIDCKILSEKLSVRDMFNMVLVDKDFAFYLFTKNTQATEHAINRLKFGITPRECLALVAKYPKFTELILDGSTIQNLSTALLSQVQNSAKFKDNIFLQEVVSQELLKRKEETHVNVKHEQDIQVENIGQHAVIEHAKKIYTGVTKIDEPMLGQGGVCAGLVALWIKTLKESNNPDQFNNKLRKFLSNNEPTDSAFVHKVYSSYVALNLPELQEQKKDKFSITIKGDLDKPDVKPATKSLGEQIKKIILNDECFIHISLPNHDIGLAIKKNKTGEPEILFYDPNYPKGMLNLGKDLDKGLTEVMEHISKYYQKNSCEDLKIDFTTYQSPVYELSNMFSLKK